MGYSSTLETISIDLIRTDGGTQSRAAINDEVVAEYAEAITGGDDFPPVTVYFDGKRYWLSDGFHRTAAYQKAGAIEVQAEVRQGDKRAAVLHSVGVNAQHGLRRTNADKRRAVMVLLDDPEWAAWSDREIGRRCGVHHNTVSGLRPSGEKRQIEKTVERDGKTYTMNTEKIGSSKTEDKPKPEETSAAPEASAPTSTSLEPSQETLRGKSPYVDLTREALEDDHAALHEAYADLQKKFAARNDTITRLETQIADLSSSDKGATISKLDKQRMVLKGRLDDAMTATKREEYKRKKAEARVAELESMEIAL